MTMEHINAWTDYPFAALGDEEGKKAPVRKIEVLSYDRNKYCTVRVVDTDVFYSIKAGYIYSKEGRYADAPGLEIEKYEESLPRAIYFDRMEWAGEFPYPSDFVVQEDSILVFSGKEKHKLLGIWFVKDAYGYLTE